MRAIVAPIAETRGNLYGERFSQGTREALATPPERRTPLQALLALKAMPQITYEDRVLLRDLKPDAKKRYTELEAELKKYDNLEPPHPPEAQTIIDNGRVAPPTFTLAVGNWDAPLEEGQPGFLSI